MIPNWKLELALKCDYRHTLTGIRHQVFKLRMVVSQDISLHRQLRFLQGFELVSPTVGINCLKSGFLFQTARAEARRRVRLHRGRAGHSSHDRDSLILPKRTNFIYHQNIILKGSIKSKLLIGKFFSTRY